MPRSRSAFIDPNDLEQYGGRSDLEDQEHNSTDHDKATHTEVDTKYNDKNETQADDPHGEQQFCVDISEYLDLKWVLKDSEVCLLGFELSCQSFSKNIDL